MGRQAEWVARLNLSTYSLCALGWGADVAFVRWVAGLGAGLGDSRPLTHTDITSKCAECLPLPLERGEKDEALGLHPGSSLSKLAA